MPTPYYTKIESDAKDQELRNSILEELPNVGGGTETATTMGALINSADDATPNDSNLIGTAISDGILKKATHLVIEAFYKLYYDTIYQAILVIWV